jgi:hypothetical protein
MLACELLAASAMSGVVVGVGTLIAARTGGDGVGAPAGGADWTGALAGVAD